MYQERPLCAEHARLLEAYRDAVALFSASTNALKEAARGDCARLALYAEQARLRSEHARIAWEAHRIQHDCCPSPFS
jgi:hypothetical protein